MENINSYIIEMALAGRVVCNIGQVNKATARRLDRLAKAGEISKWRGYWFPVSGGSWGIGSLESCWAKIDAHGVPSIGNHAH